MSDKAIKLFEALSGVDHELLERCNREDERKETVIRRHFWQNGKAMAACICLVAIGALTWSGYRLIYSPYGAQGPDSAAQNFTGMSEMEAAVTEDTATAGVEQTPGEAKSEEIPELASGSQSGNGVSGSSASQENGGFADRETVAEKDMTDHQKEQLESAVTDSRKELSWEEACSLETFRKYIPETVPAGYEPLAARQSAMPEQWNDLLLKWSNGEHELSLELTVPDAETRANSGWYPPLHYYSAEEFERNLIPKPSEDGVIQFTIYYPDGMELRFEGHVTADELWEMFTSVPFSFSSIR